MTWLLWPIVLLAPLQPPDAQRQVMDTLDGSELAKTQARLEQAARREPSNARAWLELARVYAQRKKAAQALAAADKAEALAGDDARVLDELARLFIELQPDLKKAAALEARYAEKKPQDQTAWRRAAALYLEAGLPQQAIEAGRRGLANDASPELRTILGQAYTAVHDWDNAAAQLKAALGPGRHDEEAHYRLAQMYILRRDYASAVGVLVNARQIFGPGPQIGLALGLCYSAMGRFGEAVDEFLKVIAEVPDARQAYILLGRIVDHAGDRRPEVARRFAEFNAANPADAEGYLLNAKALLAQSRPGEAAPQADQALALLRKSLALKADGAEARYLAGCVLQSRRQYKAALEELEKSIALDPQASAAHLHLAQVYEQLGRAREAARERELQQRLAEAEREAPEPTPGLDAPAPPGAVQRTP
ncbi:MAG: tetratricopeptide repeat protein [Bryobacteraceae bacterium]